MGQIVDDIIKKINKHGVYAGSCRSGARVVILETVEKILQKHLEPQKKA